MINTKPPAFKNESEEADWWASREGRDYAKQKSAVNQEATQTRSQGQKIGGSRLVDNLNRKRSVQIAIRLPEADIEQARKIASRKGIGYQTLLKMLVHEGLEREGKRR